MIGLAASITIAAMVGPLGPGADAGPAVRFSRPVGGPPEVIVRAGRPADGADETDRSRLIEVPDSAVAGGGGVTIVGAYESSGHATETVGELQTGLVTEQLLRAFGYDRDHFGYSYIDYPRNYRRGGGAGGGGFGGNGGQQEQPVIDPRVLGLLRDLAPIEAKYPVAIPGR